MEFKITVAVPAVELLLRNQLVLLSTIKDQGTKIMALIDDVNASLTGLEGAVADAVKTMAGAVTELDELATALKNAIDAGNTAALSVVKDRMDALKASVADSVTTLAQHMAADQPQPAAGEQPQPTP